MFGPDAAAVGFAGGRAAEGGGWVNWSELATLLDEAAGAVAALVARLPAIPGQ